jgi:hypothetical protein
MRTLWVETPCRWFAGCLLAASAGAQEAPSWLVLREGGIELAAQWELLTDTTYGRPRPRRVAAAQTITVAPSETAGRALKRRSFAPGPTSVCCVSRPRPPCSARR